MKKIVLLALGLCITSFLAAQSIQLRLDAYSNLEDILFEDCGVDTAQLVVFLDQTASTTTTYSLEFGGTAEQGADYTISNLDTVLDIGERLNIIDIVISADGIAEGAESIIVSVETSDGQQASLSITLLDALDGRILPDQSSLSVCQTEIIDLNTAAASSYSWSNLVTRAPISDEQNLSFEAEMNENILLVKTAGSCETRDTISIDLIAGRRFPEGDTGFVCLGSELNVSFEDIGDETTTFSVTPLDDLIQVNGDQITFEDTVSRWYTFTVESASCAFVDSLFIRVDSLPDSFPIMIFEEKEEYCPGEKVELFTSSNLPNRNFPDIEFLWSFQAGSLTEDADSTFANLEFITEDTSVFKRTTTNNACEVIDSVIINVLNPPIQLNFTDTTICQGDQVQIILENPERFSKIEWMPGDGLSCTECPDPTATAQSGTIDYMLMLEATTSEGETCPFGANVSVTGINEIIPVIVESPVCPGTTIEVRVDDPDSRYTDIQWSGDNLTFDDPNAATTSVTINETSTIMVQATQENGCVINGTGLVTIRTPDVQIIADEFFCVGTVVNVGVITDEVLSNVMWTSSDPITFADPSSLSTTTEVSNAVTIDFSAETEDGCLVNASSQIIPENLPGTVVLARSPSGDLLVGDTVLISAVSNILFDSFNWSYNGSPISSMNDSITIVLEEINNVVQLDYVSLQGGCPGQVSIEIPATLADPEIPNAFSPNGDEMNDLFRPYFPRSGSAQNQPGRLLTPDRFISLKIFNRWGENIFETSDNAGWDGTVDGGDLAPPAVYAYVIVFINAQGEEQKLVGDVTLLR